MGRKIINGIEVNTNLKRRRIEIKKGCQSTIIASSPKYYWQFEALESNGDISSVSEPKRLVASNLGYGGISNGIDDTQGLRGFPKGIPESVDTNIIELQYDMSGDEAPDIEDNSPLCPVPSPSYSDNGSDVTFISMFQKARICDNIDELHATFDDYLRPVGGRGP